MEKHFIVIKAHMSDNPCPIKLNKGDTVQLGEKSDNNGPWPNWIYCISNRTKSEGWTPIQMLQIENDLGVALSDYDAKEITVTEGDELIGTTDLNGWVWCTRKIDGEEGWVPKECIEYLK